MDQEEILKRLDLHIKHAYIKSQQCQSLIDQYIKDKHEYDEDYKYGQSLRLQMVGVEWVPIKDL